MPLSPEDIAEKAYKAYRDQIQYEVTLLNQRITWLVALQALLVFPYFFITNSILVGTAASTELWIARLLIGALGLGTNVVSVLGCRAAESQIRLLASGYKELS